jgi:hypothetical protein
VGREGGGGGHLLLCTLSSNHRKMPASSSTQQLQKCTGLIVVTIHVYLHSLCFCIITTERLYDFVWVTSLSLNPKPLFL